MLFVEFGSCRPEFDSCQCLGSVLPRQKILSRIPHVGKNSKSLEFQKNSKSLEFHRVHTFVVWGKEIKAVQKRTCEKRVFVSERIKHIQPRPEPGLIGRRRRSLTVTVRSGLTPSPGLPPSRHNLARQKPGTGRNQTRVGGFQAQQKAFHTNRSATVEVQFSCQAFYCFPIFNAANM